MFTDGFLKEILLYFSNTVQAYFGFAQISMRKYVQKAFIYEYIHCKIQRIKWNELPVAPRKNI